MIPAFLRAVALPLLALQLICCVAAAAPTQPQVTAGQATFAQQGRVFAITNTPGTVINWQSFNIGAGEVTRFIQQGADSAVLNRVVGQDPTRILGALQSNGKVFLINPNGILFGQGARVDVNGLVASSLNLGDADFLAGRKRFETARTGAGRVQNAGAITTPAGGQVVLIAPQVENTGIITSPQGAVILAAGHSVQLADSADPDVQVVLSAPAHAAVNLGQVIAAGGRVGIYGALVRQAGLVSADSAVVGAGGRIVLRAGGTATLAAGSATHAVGRAGADGGTVEVLGAAVAIDADAQVDASGRNGGAVLAGGDWQGDWQGSGSAPRAQQTTFAAGAVIRADGDAGGGVDGGSGASGGKVVLWSDGATLAQGRISAHGGIGGVGGRVETSGRTLDVDGLHVDAAGRINGTWLLDPYDVEVVAGGTAGAGAVAVAVAGPDSKSGVTRVAPATLTAPGTNIVLHAQHDLTVTDALDAAASVFAQAGHDITVNARVASASAGNDDSLTFLAGNAFTLGANGMLRSGNNIYIEANRVSLDGTIAGTSGLLPRLGLSTTDVTLPIDIGVNRANNALMLDPRVLARLAPTLAEIDIGTDRHTGAISIDGALGMATSLVLSNSGPVRVAGPVDLGANGGNAFFAHVFGNRGALDVTGALTAADVRLTADRLALGGAINAASVTLQPDSTATRIGVGGSDGGGGGGFVVGGAALAAIQAARVTIGAPGGRGGIGVDGAVALSGIGVLALDAGSGALAITASLATAHTLVLASRAAVSESGAGKIDAAALAVRGADVTLGGANAIGTLAGAATHGFQVTAQGGLSIGDVDGLSGIGAAGASVVLDAAGIGGAGVVQAGSLVLQSSAGIGSAGAPLRTRTDTLVARNDGIGGQPVNIANAGALTLQLATNAGAGAITIDNDGALTVPPYVADTAADTVADMRGAVRTIDGDIALTARGALTIAGRVGTTGGNVRLAADGGLLTIEPGALVSSVRGRVTRMAGAENIAPDTIRDVDSAPSCKYQEAAPLTPGCAAVLAAAVRACAADPDGAGCTATVAQFAVLCAASPGAAGCADIAGGGAGRTDGQGVQLARAQQAAVRLIDTGAHDVAAPGSGQQGGNAGTGVGTGTGQDGGERTAGPVQAQEAGAKTGAEHDKPAKTYCN